MTNDSGRTRTLAILCAAGVAVRLVFLLLAGQLQLQSDEANYAYLAISWNHFGFFSDSYRYLWPPGYPYLLAWGFSLFDIGGLFAVKLLQVFASASIGLVTMLVTERLFDFRTAKIAGILWCLYLPMIGYTHLLWAETLFMSLLMPSLYLILVVMQDGARASDRTLIVSGLLFGLALYFKEVILYLAPVLALLLVWYERRTPLLERVRRATLFLLATAVVVTPWTLRNAEVYGRYVPVGTSLGENLFHGSNAAYMNWDLQPFLQDRGVYGSPEILTRQWFIRADPAGQWNRAWEIPNTPDRLSENVRRGLRYARDNPEWFVRSRIKKMADLLTPVSFFVRHQGLGRYKDSVLGATGIRHALVIWAVLCPIVVLLLAIPGGFVAIRDRAGIWLLGTVLAYFTATAMIVAMSRFRVPMVPWLIVLVAGALARGWPADRHAARGWVLSGVTGTALLIVWWVDLPELRAILGFLWGMTP